MTLTLTENATNVVKTIVEQNPGTETGGLRIDGADRGPTDFALSLVPEPLEADTVVEEGGARIFLEPTAAQVLDDKVLDAQVEQDGSVRFAIGVQEA